MKNDPMEFIIIAVILALFGVMALAGWYVNKARPARLARLREAPVITAASVSGKRVAVVLVVGMIVTGGSAPLLMAAFPDTPLMFLVSIVLAFFAVLAPLTVARGWTVDVWLRFEPQSLRFERRGAEPEIVDLTRPFTLDAKRIDDEFLVVVEQDTARVLFSYRHGPAFVTLPLDSLPAGWIRDDERFTLFGEEAAILHERLKRLA